MIKYYKGVISTITVKQKTLFAKSGNECAFPEYKEKLIYDDNKIICDIAHIKARSIGGPRYNAMQTEESEKFSLLFVLN